MRLIVGGGRAAETPDAKGAVIVGVRTLSEGGRVGNFSREQVIVCNYFLFPCLCIFFLLFSVCWECLSVGLGNL